MSNEIFAQIRELKQQGNFVDAWNCGYVVFQNDLNNPYLKRALFWVCYAAIKAIQEPILARQNKAPNLNEQNIVNSWINCIGQLNLTVPCEELDFRFFNLFKGCGEHYESYIQMLTYYGPNLYQPADLKPYKTEKGEYPSLLVRLSRQTSKAWLQHHKQWQLNLDGILNLLNYALNNALDRNKTWLQFDISKCLVSAGRYDEAREAALSVLRQKMSESWAWGALADTYISQEPKAAIACYSRGILEAHEPPFCIPMYYGLAQLFSYREEFGFASAALSKLIEIYNANGWQIKPEHEELIQQEWFDASAIESVNLNEVIKTRANDALQYATKKLEMAVGIVDSHHRSGKGFSIYLDLNKKVSSRKGVFFGKGLPEVGTWLELKLANDGQQLDVMEAHKVEPKQSERVKLIEGTLKLNSKGFGFVDDAFVAPYLLNGFNDQEHVEATKIWDKDPKKGTPSWRVIKIVKSQSTH
jgi:tetratricopeptide (TPR) repeat protein